MFETLCAQVTFVRKIKELYPITRERSKPWNKLAQELPAKAYFSALMQENSKTGEFRFVLHTIL